MHHGQKRQYMQALGCYLAIPAVLIAEGFLFRLLDPETARGHDAYVRIYQVLELARSVSMLGAAGLALALWASTCYLVLMSRNRSLGWLVLAIGGPVGFPIIAVLKDLEPGPEDLYQQLIRKPKSYWRALLEVIFFVLAWILAYESVVLKRHLMISYESFTTGISPATIIARQNASSGMWAFTEALEQFYVVVLVYLLWPILVNWTGHFLKPRSASID